jgi:hypothetical protein
MRARRSRAQHALRWERGRPACHYANAGVPPAIPTAQEKSTPLSPAPGGVGWEANSVHTLPAQKALRPLQVYSPREIVDTFSVAGYCRVRWHWCVCWGGSQAAWVTPADRWLRFASASVGVGAGARRCGFHLSEPCGMCRCRADCAGDPTARASPMFSRVSAASEAEDGADRCGEYQGAGVGVGAGASALPAAICGRTSDCGHGTQWAAGSSRGPLRGGPVGADSHRLHRPRSATAGGVAGSIAGCCTRLDRGRTARQGVRPVELPATLPRF